MSSLYLVSARLVGAENLDCHSSEEASVQIFSFSASTSLAETTLYYVYESLAETTLYYVYETKINNI